MATASAFSDAFVRTCTLHGELGNAFKLRTEIVFQEQKLLFSRSLVTANYLNTIRSEVAQVESKGTKDHATDFPPPYRQHSPGFAPRAISTSAGSSAATTAAVQGQNRPSGQGFDAGFPKGNRSHRRAYPQSMLRKLLPDWFPILPTAGSITEPPP